MGFTTRISSKDLQPLSEALLAINETQGMHEFTSVLFDKLSDLVTFSCATLVSVRDEGGRRAFQPEYAYNLTINEDAFFETMLRLAPGDYAQWALYQPKSSVFRETDIINDAVRESTEMYQRVIKPTGCHYIIDVYSMRKGKPLAVMCIMRRREDGDYTHDELEAIRFLEPHIALKMEKELSREQGSHQRIVEETTALGLTSRELEVLFHVCEGLTNAEIAQRVFLSEHTVKKHLANIYRKAKVRNRTELVAKLQ